MRTSSFSREEGIFFFLLLLSGCKKKNLVCLFKSAKRLRNVCLSDLKAYAIIQSLKYIKCKDSKSDRSKNVKEIYMCTHTYKAKHIFAHMILPLARDEVEYMTRHG